MLSYKTVGGARNPLKAHTKSVLKAAEVNLDFFYSSDGKASGRLLEQKCT